MTANRRPWSRRTLAVPRRALRALGYLDDELLRASEAIIRSARAPQPRPRAQAPEAGRLRPEAEAERADKAA